MKALAVMSLVAAVGCAASTGTSTPAGQAGSPGLNSRVPKVAPETTPTSVASAAVLTDTDAVGCPKFYEIDRQSCRAGCDAVHNKKMPSLNIEEFECQRTRDIARAAFDEQACHQQCDRDHNPDGYDPQPCFRQCDADERACWPGCSANTDCEGNCTTSKRLCHDGCTGRVNQIREERYGCNRSCSGKGNIITDTFNGCIAGVAGKRQAAHDAMEGCWKSCDGRFNFAEDCRKGKFPKTSAIHTCVCEQRDPEAPSQGTGVTRQVATDSCMGRNVCIAACAGDLVFTCY